MRAPTLPVLVLAIAAVSACARQTPTAAEAPPAARLDAVPPPDTGPPGGGGNTQAPYLGSGNRADSSTVVRNGDGPPPP